MTINAGDQRAGKMAKKRTARIVTGDTSSFPAEGCLASILKLLEQRARRTMTRHAYNYYAGGAGDEHTMRENRAAFNRIWFKPKVLAGVDRVDTSIQLLDVTLSTPLFLAPTAFHGLAHPEGELAVVRAAGAIPVVMIVSMMASTPLEKVAAHATGPVWFQIYLSREPSLTESLIERARAAGYQALVVTVDVPRIGHRCRDHRNQFELPDEVRPANLEGSIVASRWSKEVSFSAFNAHLMDGAATWDTLRKVIAASNLPVFVKGIIAEEDADRALDVGAAGIIVSNHGGRQLDGTVAAVEALPCIVDNVAGRCPVLLDGGVRLGTDVLKALALGASGVLIGRPYLWGLAAAGETGVRHVLDLLQAELQDGMTLAGCPHVRAIDRSLITLNRAAARTLFPSALGTPPKTRRRHLESAPNSRCRI